MERRAVVTCFLERGGQVLLLRRSTRVRTHPNKWAAVSGAMETPDPRAEALREVREETALSPPEVEVVAAAPPFDVPDPAYDVVWEVHPVLARLAAGHEPRLNWEHTEARWVAPDQVGGFDAVPRLAEALRRVRPG